MAKIREISLTERAAIKILKEVGPSYVDVVEQVGCSKSAGFKQIE